ncbi:MAG: hypothetical protein ACP5N1_04785 [Candidatus Woesearchaeota archaeon]
MSISNLSNKNIGRIIAGILAISTITSCEKDNIDYNTSYKWKKFGDTEYYFNEYDKAQTNVFGLKLPKTSERLYIYDLNNNLHFDKSESGIDYMIVNDSVIMGDKKVEIITKAVYAYDENENTLYVDSLMNKYLPILKDSLRRE